MKSRKEIRIGKLACAPNTLLVWALMAALAAADAAGMSAEGMSPAPRTLLPACLAVAILLMLSVVYAYFRRAARRSFSRQKLSWPSPLSR